MGSQFRHRPRFQPPSLKSVRRVFPRYGFKHQAPCSSARSCSPARFPRSLRPSTTRPAAGVRRHCVRHPPGGLAATCGGPRSVRVMLSRTSSLTDLIRQSGELPAISRHPPVIGPVLDIHWIIQASGLLLPSGKTGLPPALAAPHSSAAALAIGFKVRPLATPFIPQISFMRECLFGFIRSLSLRPSCLLAPRADQTSATFRPHRPPRAFTSGLSGHRVTPCACRISLRPRRDLHPLVLQLASAPPSGLSLLFSPGLPPSIRRGTRSVHLSVASVPALAIG